MQSRGTACPRVTAGNLVGRSYCPKGRGLSARLAALLQTGLTADCTQLDIDADTLLLHQIRPAFGGKSDGDHYHSQPSSADGIGASGYHESLTTGLF